VRSQIVDDPVRRTRLLRWLSPEEIERMGRLRRETGRRDYLAVGFLFGEGSFRALDLARRRGVQEIEVPAPPESHASVAFSRTGKPLLLLDLRALPRRGSARDWFAAPHPVRDFGGAFVDDRAQSEPVILLTQYDAVVYVDRTTPAHPMR